MSVTVNRGQLVLTYESLMKVLQHENHDLLAIEVDNTRRLAYLIVSHPSLPVVHEGQEPPFITAEITDSNDWTIAFEGEFKNSLSELMRNVILGTIALILLVILMIVVLT